MQMVGGVDVFGYVQCCIGGEDGYQQGNDYQWFVVVGDEYGEE